METMHLFIWVFLGLVGYFLWRSWATARAKRSGAELAKKIQSLIDEKGRIRVAVEGICGSGKSTLAKQLASLWGVESLHMDYVQFKGQNWETYSREEVKARVGEWVNRNNEKGWVVDGNHKSSPLMSHCDLILMLDLPFFTVTFWRLLRRTIERIITKEKLFGNNVEGWENVFKLWDPKTSLVAYAVVKRNHNQQEIPGLLKEFPHLTCLFFTSPEQLSSCLEHLTEINKRQ